MNKEIKQLILAVSFVCAGVLFLFLEPLFTPQNILNFSDVIHVWYFFKYFTVESFKKFGELPLWNPLIYSGVPFAGNPQSTLFYPPFILFFFVPVQWAVTVMFALHLVFAGTGFYIFARRKNLSFGVSLFSCAVFILNWKVIGHVFAGHLTQTCSWAYIPWLFLSVENLSEKPDFRNTVLISVCASLIFLCGQMQIFYYQMMIGSVYLIYLIISGESGIIFKTVALYFISAVTALVLAAVSIIPILELISQFHRSGGTDYYFATSYSLRFRDLVTLIYPHFFVQPAPGSNTANKFFWESAVYAGILPLFLGLISYKYQNRKNYLFFVYLLLFSLLFSLGANAPVFKIMYIAVPGIKYFRCPARMFLFGSFSIALLSGFGFQYILNTAGSNSIKHLCRLIFIVGLILVVLNELLFYLGGKIVPGYSRSIVILLISGAVLFFWNKGYLSKKMFRGIVFAVTLFDLGALAYPLIESIPADEIFPYSKIYKPIIKDNSAFRVFDNAGVLPQYAGAYYNLAQIGGDEPVMLGNYLDYINKMYLSDNADGKFSQTLQGFPVADFRQKFDCALLNLLNVKYVYSVYHIKTVPFEEIESFDMEEIGLAHFCGKYPMKVKIPKLFESKTYLYRNPCCLPRGFAVQSDIGSIDTAVDSVLYGCGKNNGIIEAQAGYYSPNKISFKTDCTEPSYFVASEIRYPGWKAYVNGTQTAIIPVKNLFRGLNLPAGKNIVEFVYKPESYFSGKYVSLSGWLILAVLALCRNAKNCKKIFVYCFRKTKI